jgi:hypothetical protein
VSKGWTEERRKKQAESIRKHKPWEHATGPKTKKGKARSRYNALVTGQYAARPELGAIPRALAAQREFMAYLCLHLKASPEDRALWNELLKKRAKSKT